MNCEYCLETFRNSEELTKHNKQGKTCIKYKDILFVCKKCKFSISGIKNIDKHIKSCNEETNDNLSYELISDEEQEDENVQLKILLRIEN